ncbi:MAG: TerB family tellurite resistance protein [Xenococcaceae cyanobacterium MO_188.B32]|nr:TerB family tellurite resistance protein [Xenococcaceae cyanobacterium MO_188.B32]
MAGLVSAIEALLAKYHQKVRSRQFLEAVMGASAMLALADGEISFAELMARDYVLDRVRELQVFDPNEAAELFRTYAETISIDPKRGKTVILEAITQLSGDAELASLLLRICVVIGKSDCDFSQREREVIHIFGDVLGLEKGEIDRQL